MKIHGMTLHIFTSDHVYEGIQFRRFVGYHPLLVQDRIGWEVMLVHRAAEKARMFARAERAICRGVLEHQEELILSGGSAS